MGQTPLDLSVIGMKYTVLLVTSDSLSTVLEPSQKLRINFWKWGPSLGLNLDDKRTFCLLELCVGRREVYASTKVFL